MKLDMFIIQQKQTSYRIKSIEAWQTFSMEAFENICCLVLSDMYNRRTDGLYFAQGDKFIMYILTDICSKIYKILCLTGSSFGITHIPRVILLRLQKDIFNRSIWFTICISGKCSGKDWIIYIQLVSGGMILSRLHTQMILVLSLVIQSSAFF